MCPILRDTITCHSSIADLVIRRTNMKEIKAGFDQYFGDVTDVLFFLSSINTGLG